MGQLLTAAEVATLANVTPRQVRRRACELLSEPAPTPSRNGRRARLYHLSSLSPALQAEFLKRKGESTADVAQPALDQALTLPAGSNLGPEGEVEAQRRYSIIEPLIKPEAFRLLWAEYGNRRGRLIDSIAGKNGLSRRTLYAWFGAWVQNGLSGLVTSVRKDKGHPRRFNAAALDFILSAAFPRPGEYGKLSPREIFRLYTEERAWRESNSGKPLNAVARAKYLRYLDQDGRLTSSAQLPAASGETIRRWFNRIPDVAKVMAREGNEAFSNTQEIISFRDLAALKPLEYVVMDHRMLDLFCLVEGREGWKLVRPWLTAAIDFRTRKWLGWAIVETPSSDSIASVLKRVFLDWGVPEACLWDNGKDFCCEWLQGLEKRQSKAPALGEMAPAFRGVMETLGVRVHHAIVRRARAKIIEPCFIATANFDKSLPEYCGHKPDARPEQLAKLIEQHERWTRGQVESTPFRTIEEIAGLYEEQLETINEREHPGQGMGKITPNGRGWMCPNEAWESLTRGMEIRKAPEDLLAFCFHRRKELTVRNGEIRATFGGRQFHYRLVDANALALLNGREVQIGYDVCDLEDVAIYCDGRFVGLAHNAELRRMGEESFVQDERDRRALRRDVKAFIRTVHSAVPVANPAERAARRAAVRPARIYDGGTESAEMVPASIRDAAGAAKREGEFKFANAGADLVRTVDRAVDREDDLDDEFQFFQEG